MSALRPKNWAEFQHYKDRSPAWIKLHRGILDDFDYSCLPIASKALAPLLWLLASEHKDGDFSSDPQRIAHRLRWSVDEVIAGLKPLLDKGFFELASGVLADCYQDACLEERRGEDIKQRGEKNTVPAAPARDEEFELAWTNYPKRAGTNSKADAKKQWDARVKSGVSPGALFSGTLRYKRFVEATGKVKTEMVMQASRFYGPGRNYEGEFPIPVEHRPQPSNTLKTFLSLGDSHAVDERGNRTGVQAAALPWPESPTGAGHAGWDSAGVVNGSHAQPCMGRDSGRSEDPRIVPFPDD